jgi:hypothetical protein
MKNQILEEIYNDASQPGSLSGLENFYRVLKSQKLKKTSGVKKLAFNSERLHKTQTNSQTIST